MRAPTHLVTLCAGLLFLSLGCSQPQSSGTKTNWFKRCDTDGQCGDEGVCLCGVCSEGCNSMEDCASGACASEIATAVQCGNESTHPAQICLSDSAETVCQELPLPLGGELGQPESCALPGALLCESFDTPLSPSASSWIVNDASGALQECVTREGSGALVERAEGGALIQTRFRLPEPVEDGTLYVRFFFRISSSSVLPDQTTIFEFWDQETEPLYQTSLLVKSDGSLETFVRPGSHLIDAGPAEVLPRDTWLCLELAEKLGLGDGSITVSVDGRTVIDAPDLTTQAASPLVAAVLQTQPIAGDEANPVEFYFDELVIGTTPIGCD